MTDRVLSARVLSGDPEALGLVKAAIDRAGSIKGAAAALGVPVRTLSRWVERAAIRATLTGKAAAGSAGGRAAAKDRRTPRKRARGVL